MKDINQYKNIKPLVIGIGVQGKRHLEAQLNLGIKTGIYSTNLRTRQLYRKNAGVIVFDNLEEGIDWSNLVHICTPDDKHTKFVAEAIKKRKTVLCEKAFTTSLKDALFLQKLAHKYGATVVVGQNYRLTPTFAETRKEILAGQLGAITKIETTYYHDRTDYHQRYPSRKMEDFIYRGGSHAVDLACWIAGDQIVNSKVVSTNMLKFQITAKFSSGLMGDIMLDASSTRPINGTDLIVTGINGKLVSHNKKDELLFYKKDYAKPQRIKLPNTQTLTIPLEIKIVDDYLSGKLDSYWPLPTLKEAVNLIKILDAIEKAVSSPPK